MSIVLVYHPEERANAQGVADALSEKGLDVAMAPLGLQVGSPEWIKQARRDIEAAAVCIVLISEKSVRDTWVGTRLEWALARKIPLIPLQIGWGLNDWSVSPRELKIPPQIQEYQMMVVLDEGIAKDVANRLYRDIHGYLPVQCFLSYSRQDQQFADRLQQALQDRRVLVWRDTSNIPGGADWDEEIENAMRKSNCILVVASKAAFASPNVADEISFARNSKKRIIPVLIEEVQLPFRIHRAQAIDFRRGFEDSLQKLLVAIRGETVDEAEISRPAPARQGSPGLWSWLKKYRFR
jgi:TIR domain